MKAARWVTGSGSLLLFIVGVVHEMAIGKLDRMIAQSGLKPPASEIFRACWLLFGGEMMALAVIAWVASRVARGAGVVLVCGLAMLGNAAILLKYLGSSIQLYVTLAFAVIFLTGAWMQSKASA